MAAAGAPALRRAAWAGLLGLGCSGGADVVTVANAEPVPSASACAAALGQSAAALSIVDRSLVGAPVGYAADLSLGGRELELSSSLRLRRQVGWDIATRVLEPLPLATAFGAERGATLPLWQTWHNKDDLTRIFRRLYPELGPDERRTRAAFGSDAIDAAWAWNDAAVADFDTWTLERLTAYRDAIGSAAELAGLGGIERVAYAPAASRHTLESYGEALACRTLADPPPTPPSSARLAPAPGACAARPSFEPLCLAGQFPATSVLVKANWQRLDAGPSIRAFDTSAEAMARRLSPPGGFAWGDGDRKAAPGDGDMYTIELPNGNRFGLTGLHIMTKELEHWVWVTLWWSDAPDQDFGADRPASFPAAFAHYKLCSVVGFEEGDEDPAGGFDATPSLAQALAATSAGAGAPTWCSNPYIETGAGNASTNCIGCHQHAGTSLRSADILGRPGEFPDFGRDAQRTTFLSDYVFSMRTGDDLGAMFNETEDHSEGGAP